MDINSLYGATAYTNVPKATPPVDNTQVQNQNLDVSRTDLSQESAGATQKAFEVTITPEAQDRMATATTQEPAETQTPIPENQNNQSIPPAQEATRLINIVA